MSFNLSKVISSLKANDPDFSELHINDRSIHDEEIKALATAIKTNHTLTVMTFTENFIGDEGAKALAAALQPNHALTIFNIACNSIGDEGAKALAPVLLKTNQTLITLNLEGNSIGDEGAKALAIALKTNQTLMALHLGSNRIGDEGAKALAATLQSNQTLTKLHLRGNSIGDGGAKALAAALQPSQTLMTLYLGSNRIGDEGAKALATALKTNQTLMTLELENNFIGDEGAKALAAALQPSQTLMTLYLGRNRIGDEGAKALATALKTNQTLMTLDLKNNSIQDEFLIIQIEELMRSNRSRPIEEPAIVEAEEVGTDDDEAKVREDSDDEDLPPGLEAERQNILHTGLMKGLKEMESWRKKIEGSLALFLPRDSDDIRSDSVIVDMNNRRVQELFFQRNITESMRALIEVCQGREAEFASLLQREGEYLIDKHEKLWIRGNPILYAFYTYFIRVLTSTLQLSELCRTRQVKDLVDKFILNHDENIAEGAKVVAKKVFDIKPSIPILSEGFQVVRNAYSFKCALEHRKEAIRVVNFFDPSENPAIFIEALARQLTIFQTEHLVEIAGREASTYEKAKNLMLRVLKDDRVYGAEEEEISLRKEAHKDCAHLFLLMQQGVLGENLKCEQDLDRVFSALLKNKQREEPGLFHGRDLRYESPFEDLIEKAAIQRQDSLLASNRYSSSGEWDIDDWKGRLDGLEQKLAGTSDVARREELENQRTEIEDRIREFERLTEERDLVARQHLVQMLKDKLKPIEKKLNQKKQGATKEALEDLRAKFQEQNRKLQEQSALLKRLQTELQKEKKSSSSEGGLQMQKQVALPGMSAEEEGKQNIQELIHLCNQTRDCCNAYAVLRDDLSQVQEEVGYIKAIQNKFRITQLRHSRRLGILEGTVMITAIAVMAIVIKVFFLEFSREEQV